MSMRDQVLVALASGPCMLGDEHAATVCLNGLANMPVFADQAKSQMLSERMEDDSDTFWPEPGSWLCSYRPYLVDSNGILQIPVKGVLVNNMSYALGNYATGYPYIREAVKRGLADANVRGIALIVNTPGGDVSGNFDLCDYIYAARGQKPIRGFAVDYAYSAGYSIISSANVVSMVRTGGVGSIGVIAWHMDLSGMFEKMGIVNTPIFAGSAKTDMSEKQPLSAEAKARAQSRIDNLRVIFAETVAKNREKLTVEAVKDTEAQVYEAAEALEIGLIDSVGSVDELVSLFASDLNGYSEDTSMTTPTNVDTNVDTIARADHDNLVASATATATTAGATAERGRIAAIMDSDVGKARPVAARRIALTTSMSKDEAVELLGGLPEEAAVTTTPAPKAKTNADGAAFEEAMNTGKNPNVNTTGTTGTDDSEDRAATPAENVARLRSTHAYATGAAPAVV